MNKVKRQHFAVVPHTNFLFMVVYEVLLKCMNSDDVVDTVVYFPLLFLLSPFKISSTIVLNILLEVATKNLELPLKNIKSSVSIFFEKIEYKSDGINLLSWLIVKDFVILCYTVPMHLNNPVV